MAAGFRAPAFEGQALAACGPAAPHAQVGPLAMAAPAGAHGMAMAVPWKNRRQRKAEPPPGPRIRAAHLCRLGPATGLACHWQLGFLLFGFVQ